MLDRPFVALEHSRLSVERDMEYTTAYEPSTMQEREADPNALH